MKNIQFAERLQQYFQSLFDQAKHTNKRLEDIYLLYDDLKEFVDQYGVLNQERDGIDSQNINIKTTFGNTDPDDPRPKEFRFEVGSVLRYMRVLEITHKDRYELVNLQTLFNIIDLTSSDFMKKTGDIATGAYTFKKSGPNQIINFEDIPVEFHDRAKAYLAPLTDYDIVNKGHLEDYVDQKLSGFSGGTGISGQPLFVSAKIAIGASGNIATIRQKGAYDASILSIGNDHSAWKIKLLKFNAKTAWDGSDRSWQELIGGTVAATVPGHSLGNANSRIPYPVDYDIYLEADVSSKVPCYSQFVNNGASRIRICITDHSGRISSNGIFAENVLYIDSDGDLALMIETGGSVNVPYSIYGQALNCTDIANPVLYVVVRSWSYYPTIQKYIDKPDDGVPQLLCTDQTWNKTEAESTGNTEPITRQYRLKVANLDNVTSWTVEYGAIGIIGHTVSQDAQGFYASFDLPKNAPASYVVTVKVTGKDYTNATVNLQRNVTLILQDYSYTPLTITSNSFAFERWDLYPDPLPVEFIPAATGGDGTKTWSVVADANTTLADAAFNTSSGKYTGNYSAPGPRYIMCKVQDGKYNCNATPAGTIASGAAGIVDGTGTNFNTVLKVGDWINVGTFYRKVKSVASDTQCTIDTLVDGETPFVAGSSFTVYQGAAFKLIKITVDEFTDLGDTVGDTGGTGDICFAGYTYILMADGTGKHFTEVLPSDMAYQIDPQDHILGRLKLIKAKINDVHSHIRGVEMISVKGLDVTYNHLFATSDGLWHEANKLTSEHFLVKLSPELELGFEQFSCIETCENPTETVWNITTELGTYFVSSNPNGPWYLVHNHAYDRSDPHTMT